MADKRLFCILWVLLAAVSLAWGADPQKAVERFVKDCGIKPGSVAVKVIDLDDGKVIAAHNDARPLVPASIMKSVTTAALLQKTGIDYRYDTKVYIDGPVDMGIVRGNIIVEGACDPSLNSHAEPVGTDILAEIVDALKRLGINRVEGDIIIDESQFAGPSRPASWQRDDYSTTYGTGSHALNFENNTRGKHSVEFPEKVFTTRLKARLRNAGIIIDGKDIGEGIRTPILDHYSAPVDEIMRSCMMRSDNLFAESMLRTFGKLSGGDGSTVDAAERETKMWRKEKLPMDGVEIIDGSGLSRANRVTADFMGAVLSKMSDNPDYASFFPLAGQEGTLKSFLSETDLDSYIAMKTGSMKGIQCYAGYKIDDDYVPTHAVVVIMNDITGSRAKAKKAAEKMLLDIFEDFKPSQSDSEATEPEVAVETEEEDPEDINELQPETEDNE